MYADNPKSARRGIPTVYRGIRMRSLLEARWACFFTAMGWDWVYEPFELPGWIPDFLIHGKPQAILVDVKPDFELCNKLVKKIERATDLNKYAVFITAGAPYYEVYKDYREFSVGWITDDWCGSEWGWQNATILEPSEDPRANGLGAGWVGRYYDRITGTPDFHDPSSEKQVRAVWDIAGNHTQWKGSFR